MKREKYVKIVKKLIDWEHRQNAEEKGRETDKVARLFYEGSSHNLWRVLYMQVKKVDFRRERAEVMTEIFLNSLDIVEKALLENLPLNRQGLSNYLQQKYLCHLENG